MPVFQLSQSFDFPPPELAEKNGLLAIGGDLHPQRLIAAYSQGIFPWYSEGDPLLWWFTNPRLVIFPQEFRIPNRLQRYYRNSGVISTIDHAFPNVIQACAATRTENGDKTWISEEMQAAYVELHHMGFAHSVECWQQEKLVGGLYGIALDKVFFGESMFSITPCASQYALIDLITFLKRINTQIVDCQMTTNHLLRFGAREISGRKFQSHLKKYIREPIPHENWKKHLHDEQ